MRITEQFPSELTQLSVRFFTSAFSRPGRTSNDVVILQFDGRWAHRDGLFMLSVAKAAVEYWTPSALIYDLRSLEYHWGDEMLQIMNAGEGRWVDGTHFPIA